MGYYTVVNKVEVKMYEVIPTRKTANTRFLTREKNTLQIFQQEIRSTTD